MSKPFRFVSARPDLGVAVVRRIAGGPPGAYLARGPDGSWTPANNEHVTPIDPPGTGLMAHAREALVPPDIRDDDCLAVFARSADGGWELADLYNLIAPDSGVVIRTLAIRGA